MKNIIFLIAFSLFQLNGNGQSWAPIGATWHYNEDNSFIPYKHYVLWSVEKDTIVKNKICREISVEENISCYTRRNTEYTYSSGDSIFFYEPSLDTFQMYYNFGANVGDQWTYYYQDYEPKYINTTTFTVLSVEIITINSKTLRQLKVLNERNIVGRKLTFIDYIIERIGSINYMISTPTLNARACEGNYASGLRCYEDKEFGLYNRENIDCKYSNVTKVNEVTENDLDIHGSHMDNYIIISNLDNILKYYILTINGQKITEGKILNNNIDVNYLSTGVYIINLITRDGKTVHKKFVKN